MQIFFYQLQIRRAKQQAEQVTCMGRNRRFARLNESLASAPGSCRIKQNYGCMDPRFGEAKRICLLIFVK